MTQASQSWNNDLTLLAWMFSIFISCCWGSGRWAGLCSSKFEVLPRMELCESVERSISWRSWQSVHSWSTSRWCCLKKFRLSFWVNTAKEKNDFLHRTEFWLHSQEVISSSFNFSSSQPFPSPHNHKDASSQLLKDEEHSPNTIETPSHPCVQAKRQSLVCLKPLQMDEIGELPTGPLREMRHRDCRALVALGIRTSLFANICVAPCTAILIPNSCQTATQFTRLCWTSEDSDPLPYSYQTVPLLSKRSIQVCFSALFSGNYLHGILFQHH